MSMKLYVGNLSFGTTEDDLQQLFSQVGTVESATMVTDRDTGRSRGFAFVEMSSKSEGAAAIAKFNGAELDGRSLTVNEAKPRENRGGGFGGGGRGGGFGGGRGGSGRGGFGGGRSRY
ncbi:MAG TPA: RNA-binding protein [Blastocatellia bacterium]|nr:RNA-binding protein [Blastocatellia bacterium]